ncbi:HNH endonuclease [bacterium]|nr:HNH endonuclease [bacterium]
MNGRLFPKRKAVIVNCKKCNKEIKKYLNLNLCNDCIIPALKVEEMLALTVGDIKKRYANPEKRKALNINASIRYYCGKINKNMKMLHNRCQLCHYDKHVELCHIIPINSFTSNDSATMREISSESNILILCRNHHWEFDNGVLALQDIPSRECLTQESNLARLV